MANGNVHIFPVGDLLEHDTESEDCVCGATPEAVKREDGSVGWLVTHHSLDGCEIMERKINERKES